MTAQNWTLTNTNTIDDISDISFKDEELGFLVTSGGKIFRSQDSGDNWELIYQETGMIWGNLVTSSDSLYWHTNDNGIPTRVAFSLETFDSTKKNIEILPIKPIFWNNEIWDVRKVNKMLGGTDNNFIVEEYTVSDNYIWATNSLKIYSSDDFGTTWQEHQYASFPMHGPFQGYYNGSNNMVTISRYTTTIHKTTDGENWSMHQPSETNHPEINGIHFYFIDHNRYLGYSFFGSTSKIYRTNDGGQTFLEEDLVDIPLGVYSKNNRGDVIFLYGKNGMLYKTTNFGGLSVKNDIKIKNKIKIYPNPAKEKVLIEYDESLGIQSVQLLDVSGKIIRTYDNNFKEIDIQGITKVNYLLVIKTQNEKFTEKIVVR